MRGTDSQRGFVSLFTTILLSLLLLVITLSMVTLEALQLRKAEDAEQTLRAYYTAEAGVEDAVGKVLSLGQAAATTACNSYAPTTGSPGVGYDIPGDAGWTCQQISFTGSPTGQLTKPDQAQTIDPYDAAAGRFNYGSVLVEFSQDSSGAGCYYNYSGACKPGSWPATGFPSLGQFNASTKASPVELTIVQYPHNGFSSNQVCTSVSGGAWQPGGCKVKVQNAVLVPAGGGGAAVVDYNQILAGNANQPYQAKCSASVPWNLPGTWGGGSDHSNTYHCAVAVQNMNGGGCPGGCDYLFRIRSRYGASAYKFVFMSGSNGGGTSVQVPTGSALIDVTAKAGQTYRRVISRLPLNGEAAAGLNYVMYSDTDICKNFTVINNVAQAGCPY